MNEGDNEDEELYALGKEVLLVEEKQGTSDCTFGTSIGSIEMLLLSRTDVDGKILEAVSPLIRVSQEEDMACVSNNVILLYRFGSEDRCISIVRWLLELL